MSGGELWDVGTAGHGRYVVTADNDGRVHVSVDGGRDWSSYLLTTNGAYAVTIRPEHPRWMLAGTGGGIYASWDAGRRWIRTVRLGTSAADGFSWLAGSTTDILAATVSSSNRGFAPPALISKDAGLHWQPYGSDLPAAGVMSVLSTPGRQSFAGTMGYGVWERGPSTQAWVRRPADMPATDDHGAALLITPGAHPLLLVATIGHGVFRSTDEGRTWRSDSAGLPAEDGERIVLALAYNPATHAVLAGTAEGVYELKAEG